jgi:hypothetical protein
MEMPKACGLLTEQGELKGGFADGADYAFNEKK